MRFVSQGNTDGALVDCFYGFSANTNSGDCSWPAHFFAASFVRCEFVNSEFPQIGAPLNFTDCSFHGGRLGIVSVLASHFERCHFYDLGIALSVNDQAFRLNQGPVGEQQQWNARRFACGHTRPTIVINCLFSNVSTAIMVTSGFGGTLVVRDSVIVGGGIGIDCLSCAGVTMTGGWMCGQTTALVRLRADFSDEPFTRDNALYAGRCLNPGNPYFPSGGDLRCTGVFTDCCWVYPASGTNLLDGVWLGVDTTTDAGAAAALAGIYTSPLNGALVSPFSLGATVSSAPAWPSQMQALYTDTAASTCTAHPLSGLAAPSSLPVPSYGTGWWWSDSVLRYDGTQLAINAAAAAVSTGLPSASFSASYPNTFFNLLLPYTVGTWGPSSDWDPLTHITGTAVLSGPFRYIFGGYPGMTVDVGATLTILPGAAIYGQLKVFGTLVVLGRADAYVRLGLDSLIIGPAANVTVLFGSVSGDITVQC